MAIQSAKGTYDILTSDMHKWHYLESIIHKTCELYNYKEIRTPMFESTELYVRGVGESTDIVTKEMYTFLDKGKRSLTLRPEGTAGVVRSYVQHKLFAEANQLTKLYYMGPMFRYERMQKGRTRQFYQFGVEALGSSNPSVDAEVIALSVNIFRKLGLKEVKVLINTLGDKETRMNYRQALINHFKPVVHELCADCQKRLEQNPLRVLDCKVDKNHPKMTSAPKMMDYLNESSKTFFDHVLSDLKRLNIDYELDSNLVRGLDYYNHTVYEVISSAKGFGAQTALGGGGRYNGLVEEIGGPDIPGVGFAFGMDRLILALEAENIDIASHDEVDVFIVTTSDATDSYAFTLQEMLRSKHIKAEKDYFHRKVKAQFKQADKLKAKLTVIIGEEELNDNRISIKDMKTQIQEEVKLDDVLKEIEKRMEEYHE
ncbi:histidine--tRNA ligase [Mycoplasmatota bacterium]|nr:histidine--tRNA ligase [Mycoplasmatota bacterium]